MEQVSAINGIESEIRKLRQDVKDPERLIEMGCCYTLGMLMEFLKKDAKLTPGQAGGVAKIIYFNVRGKERPTSLGFKEVMAIATFINSCN